MEILSLKEAQIIVSCLTVVKVGVENNYMTINNSEEISIAEIQEIINKLTGEKDGE